MKIAVLSSGYGFVSRGAETVVREVSRRLRTHHIVDIYGLGKGEGVITVRGLRRDTPWLKGYGGFLRCTGSGMAFHFLGLPGTVYHLESFSFAYNAFKAIYKSGLKYDLVWNNVGSVGTLLSTLYRRGTKTPFVSTDHGGYFREVINLRLRPDCVVVPTPEALVRNRIKKVEVRVIPHGVDIDMFRPDVKPLDLTKFGIRRVEHPIIYSSSALEPSKRIPLLIRAMKELGEGTLILTNDGTQRRAIIEYGQKLLGSRFVWLGVLPHDVLPRVYALCDVYVLPSRQEFFGIVLLEALASNKPVVAQKSVVQARIIGRGGILANLENTSEFASAIDYAYHHDFGNEPRKQAERYSWDKIAQRYEELFESLIGNTID